MSRRLATQLREQVSLLVAQYDEQLRTVPGYANLPAVTRHELEQRVLLLIADCVETQDEQPLLQYIQERAQQVLMQGFQAEWFQQAVTVPQEIITPLIETVVEGNFVWRMLSHAQAAAWQIIAQERHHIELILRESEARYQTIFDSTPIMFWLKDMQNRTLRINKAAAAFEGVNPADVEGVSAYDLYPREQAEAFYQDDLSVIHSDRPKLGIIEQHTSVGTGKLMWVETGKTPVHNDKGEIIGVLAFAIDITDRQQAADKLRENEKQYREAITAAGAVPYYIDYVTESYRFIGEAIEKLTGYQAEEITPTLLGQMIQETVMTGRGDNLSREEAIQKARGGDLAGWNADYRLVDRAGHTHWLSDSSIQVFNDLGKPIGAIGILQDITERKQLEQRTQESLERRGRQVQISTEVAQEVASATDEKELFQRVVTLIKERFNYYHAQLFRYESTQNAVVLIAGYGEIGQTMLQAAHKLQMGRGVVGTAAAFGKSILATDVTQDSDWRPNPNLPDTQGELAVPIKWRDNVLGILDVQSDRAGELTDDDRLLLEGLCGQIATAMESQRLLESVQQSEQLMRTLIDAIPDYIYAKDLEGRHILSNAALVNLYGLSSPAEMVGKTDFDFYPRELAEQYHASELPILCDGQSLLAHEEPNIGADGRFRWNSTTKVPLRDGLGSIIGLVGITTDITERKRVEEVLRRNEAQLSEALHLAKLGYWEFDVAKDVFLFNDQFYAIFHTTADREGGYQLSSAQYAHRFVHPEDLSLVGAEIEKALTSSERHYSRQLEHRILYADGGVGYIAVNVNVERDEQGRIVRYYGANQDITERKRVESELERSAQLLRTIINTSRDLIYIKDTESRFLVASQATARLLGVPSPDDLLGKNDYDFLPYDLAHKYYTDEQNILQAGEPLIDIEEPSVYPDGTPVWLLTTKIPYRSLDGKLEGIVGIGRDITERKRTEQRLEETLHETERLYAAVSHENWQTYRQTSQLGEGYLFNQALIQPADNVWEPEIAQAVEQQALITSRSEQRAVTVSPLAVRGEAIGALGVYDDPSHPLSKEDLELIEAVAGQVALALESARLFDQTQRDAEREHTINRVTSRIRNARSVDEVLSIAAQELRLATRASRSVVEILPDTDQAVHSGNGEGVKA